MQVFYTNHHICMKPLITLLMALCLYTATNAQSGYGIYISGLPVISIGAGGTYMYTFGKNSIGASAGIGLYDSYPAFDADVTLPDGSVYVRYPDKFYNLRLFANHSLGKRTAKGYVGGGVQSLIIVNPPWGNLVGVMPEVHGGLSFKMGGHIRANLEIAFAAGPVTGQQEVLTDFGWEIKNGTKMAIYVPINFSLYWQRH